MSPAKWENKEWCIHYLLQPPLMVDPERNSGLRQNRLPAINLSASQPPHPNGSLWGDSGQRKQDSYGAYQRNNFNKPRLLHLHKHREMLNSFTQGVWFSLINSRSSDYLVFVYKNFLCIWLHPSIFKTIPQSYLRGCFFGLSPLVKSDK